MGRTWRDVPAGPFASERQRRFEEQRKAKSIEAARQQSSLLQKLDRERAEQKAWNKVLFCLEYMLDKRLEELEHDRDEHAPKNDDDEWDETFRNAIEKISEVRRARDDVYFAYLNMDRDEFSDWI